MQKDMTPDNVVAVLAAQGVTAETARAQSNAAALASVLKIAAPAYARLAFEEEPAGYLAEQRRNAP